MRAHISKIIAHNLRELRSNTGETQAEVSKHSSVSFRNYQSLETGTGNPSIGTLSLLAEHFKASVCRLVRLNGIRINDLDAFQESLNKKIYDAPFAAILRDLDGQVFWVNKLFSQMSKFSISGTQKNILNRASPSAKEVLRLHYDAQKRGIAEPTIFDHVTEEGEKLFLRSYPILVYQNKERSPRLALAYASLVERDSDRAYYEFCSQVLDAI